MLMALSNRLTGSFDRMTTLQLLAANLVNGSHVPIRALELKPPLWSTCDEEIEQASRQAFTAYELAMRRGHHPRLWQAVKDSPFQAHYELNISRETDW